MCCTALPDDVPFSLTCSECDAGMEVTSHSEAIALGWLDIVFAPDLPMANFLGLCPECRRQAEAECGEAEPP